MRLQPPSILLPIAGASLAYVALGRNPWAIGAGVLAGALGNALLNLQIVKNDAAKRLGADVGMGPRVPGASLGKEVWGAFTGESPLPIYSDASLKLGEVQGVMGGTKADEQAGQLTSPTALPGTTGSSSDPSVAQKWVEQMSQLGIPQVQQAVAGPGVAPKAARKAPPGHPGSRRSGGR